MSIAGHAGELAVVKREDERTSVRAFEWNWSWGWFSNGELVPPRFGGGCWDHGRSRRGVGKVLRRLWGRSTADTALKSEEGADLCAEARFLALATVGVRQIGMKSR